MRQLKHFSANGRTNDCDNEFFSSSAYDECPDQNDVFNIGTAFGGGDGVDGATTGAAGGKIVRISRIRRKRRYHQQHYELFEMDAAAVKSAAIVNKNIPHAIAGIRNVLDRVQCEISSSRSEYFILYLT